jgi:hypothetical protein
LQFTVQQYFYGTNTDRAIITDGVAKVLKQDSISMTDDFFALGGHSLSMMTLFSQLKNFG